MLYTGLLLAVGLLLLLIGFFLARGGQEERVRPLLRPQQTVRPENISIAPPHQAMELQDTSEAEKARSMREQLRELTEQFQLLQQQINGLEERLGQTNEKVVHIGLQEV